MGNHLQNVSRRDLMKFGGLATAGILGSSVLASCSASSDSGSDEAVDSTTTSTAAGHLREGLPSFLTAPETISEVSETKEYDVVVIGAGASGIPAALSACEAGASVALIQKESTAISQGNSGAGIIMETSNLEHVQALISLELQENQHRPTRALYNRWAENSGDAVQWVIDRALESGASVVDTGNTPQTAVAALGYDINFITSFFGPKPYSTNDGMQALALTAENYGVEIFYSTTAEQLVKEGDAVTGVIASQGSDYVKFVANKGVIVAAGDYQNNEEMSNYYQPDLKNFTRKQVNKTGDGHKMIVWAGGKMEDLGHTKMLHDFDAGPSSMCDMPFLAVKDDGTRFVNEKTVEMSLMNNYLRSESDQGWYSQIFDSNYMDQAADWPGSLYDPEALELYMPEVEMDDRTGVFEGLVRTFRADTLEELAEKLEITDIGAFVSTVERYNELVALGSDEDFGKPAEWLTSIDTPPYYGIHRWMRISAICSGVDINENHQCLTPEGEAIEGLYAVGNCAGHFYGGVDYPLTVFGLSLGRCYTEGYVIGKMVAEL